MESCRGVTTADTTGAVGETSAADKAAAAPEVCDNAGDRGNRSRIISAGDCERL